MTQEATHVLVVVTKTVIALQLGGLLAGAMGFSAENVSRRAVPNSFRHVAEHLIGDRGGWIATGVILLELRFLGIDFVTVTFALAIGACLLVALSGEHPWIYVAPWEVWLVSIGLFWMGALVGGALATIHPLGAVVATFFIGVSLLFICYHADDYVLCQGGITRHRWFVFRLPSSRRPVSDFACIRIRPYRKVHRVVLCPPASPLGDLEIARKSLAAAAWTVAQRWAAATGLPIDGTKPAGIEF